MAEQEPLHLEPRVAKLEVGLDRLTEDVRSLAGIVRDQGSNIEKQLQGLTVAVTQAQAPRKTDWSVIIAAVGLVMAIGAAVMIPINQTAQDNKVQIQQYHTSMVEHMKLDMHPVGLALVQRLEEQLKIHTEQNQKDLMSHITADSAEHELTRKHFHEELEFMQKLNDSKSQLLEAEMKGMKDRLELYTDKLFQRVVSLESSRITESDKNSNELMLWRQKAMGLSSPNAVVPLVPRETDALPKK